MDQTPLVEMQIQDGKRFVEALMEEGISVVAAAWLREEESGQWYLYIVTPLVGKGGGTRDAYGRLGDVWRRLPQPFWVGPSDFKVIGPSHPIAEGLVKILKQVPGYRASPNLWGVSRLGNLSIEAGYLYPLPAAATREYDRNTAPDVPPRSRS